jgi:hypothetical protein
LYVDRTLITTAQNDQLDGAGGRPESLVKIIYATNRLATCHDDQVTFCEAGSGRWAVVLHHPNQQPVSRRQTNRTPHPAGDVRRHDADAKPRAIRGLATPQRVNLASQCLVSWYRQVEAFTETVGVQA